MLRLMVQGDRDAKGIEDAVRQLGMLCSERGIGLNVGEAGKIVHLLAETGAHVRVHQAKPEPPNVPEGFSGEIVDCDAYARDNLWHGRYYGGDVPSPDRIAWCFRLACLNTSDGFIFFPGREGTLAHLVPIMAFIKKGEVDKGVARPRRVALVGWQTSTIMALMDLFGLTGPDATGNTSQWINWFAVDSAQGITSDAMASAVDWLTDGLPVV